MALEVSFDNPAYLWYLLGVPLLIYTHFYLLRNTRQKAIQFANFEAIKRVSGQKLLTKNLLVLFTRSLLISCIIFSVAGTTLWYSGEVSENDFVIAIDTSASMAAQDLRPTRIEAAKKYAIDLVNGMNVKGQFALITFAGTTFIETNMMEDKDLLVSIIGDVETSITGGTDIPGAIITSTNMLLASQKGKTMIILTDGSSTVSSFMTNSMKNALDYAKRNHVVIHAIGIGTETGPIGYLPEYYNISSVYNENALFQIANETQGRYIHVQGSSELDSAKNEIVIESSKAMIPVRLSYGLMLVVLTLLFLEWGLISTRYRRIP